MRLLSRLVSCPGRLVSYVFCCCCLCFFFFKQKTAYEMRISDWSSDVCSSDLVMRRGRVYYAKLGRGRAMFIAPRLVPHFHAMRGVRRADEARVLSRDARAVLKVLRAEWEMSTSDLRRDRKSVV